MTKLSLSASLMSWKINKQKLVKKLNFLVFLSKLLGSLRNIKYKQFYCINYNKLGENNRSKLVWVIELLPGANSRTK